MKSTIRNFEVIQKGWGEEHTFANNEHYCGKRLRYMAGSISSGHFHVHKHETFLIVSGAFMITTVDPVTAQHTTRDVLPGDVIELPPGTYHQITCLSAGDIFEVSTPHSDDDVVRIAPGDSQKPGG